MEERDDLAAALAPIVEALERLGVVWYVGGSVASTIHGRFRATNDVDLVADLTEEHASAIASALAADHYVSESAVRDAVRSRGSFNVVHLETGLKIDVFLAQEGAFAAAARSRRVRTPLGPGPGDPSIWVASPEDVILTKLVWFRAGGGVSERQWGDVLGVVQTRGAALDTTYLRAWAPPLRVADLLEDALAGRARPTERGNSAT